VFLNEDEVDVMAETGAHLSHTAYLAAKRAYFPPMPCVYKRHAHVALGSDWCSNDIFQIMKMAIALARHQAEDVSVVDARDALRMATLGGARALGLQDEIGSLVPGKKADIITVDLRTPWCSPIRQENLISNIVYNASGPDVSDVIIDGTVVVRDRVVKSVDEHEALREGQAVADTVWERASSLLS
jgi:5-methylthioadenosine/S-adenosylhomocysteine deaminase